jgi:cysteinyl-tRNA synthetase
LQIDPEGWFAGSDDAALSPDDIQTLIARRNEARAEKDFAAADAIRDELASKGVSIEDGPGGTRWRRTG